MFPCATARWRRTKDPMGSKCDEDGTRDPLGFTRAPASSAHRDQGSTRFFARGMIARVVRLPAFRAGLKNELAQRFCCRCPACDPSTRRLPHVAVLAFFPVPSLRNVHKLSPRRLPSAPLLHLVIVMLLLRAGGSACLRGPLVATARAPALLGLAPFIAPLALRSPHIRLCAFRWRAGSLAAHRAGCLARSASASRSLWYVGPYCCAASSFRIMCVCEEPALFNKHCLVACLRALSDASAAALPR